MIPAQIAHVVLPCIVAVSIVLMLIRPRGIPEVWWISGGTLLLIALRLVPLKLAGQAVAKGSDVYLFLIGMMLLSELAREQGVFDWVASVAVRGRKWQLLPSISVGLWGGHAGDHLHVERCDGGRVDAGDSHRGS